eukprot:gene11909-7385_t
MRRDAGAGARRFPAAAPRRGAPPLSAQPPAWSASRRPVCGREHRRQLPRKESTAAPRLAAAGATAATAE